MLHFSKHRGVRTHRRNWSILASFWDPPDLKKQGFRVEGVAFFEKIEPKSLPEASRDVPELTLALLGLILPLLGVIWGLLGFVLDLLWASWDAPGVLPGRSREPLGGFLALHKLPEALPEAPRAGA